MTEVPLKKAPIWKRVRNKPTWIIAGISVVLALAVLVGLAVKLYPSWQRKRLLTTAKESIEKGQFRAGVLAVRKLLTADPSNLEGCRLMARIAEHVGSPQSVYWNRRVAELEPGVFENYARWLGAAIAQHQLPSAEDALTAVPDQWRKTQKYYELAAGVALLGKQFDKAQIYYADALRLSPDNLQLRMSLATVQLQSSNAVVVQEAVTEMERLLKSDLRLAALRGLANYEVSKGRYDKALKMVKEVAADPKAVFNDRVTYLGLLKSAKDPGFAKYLESVKDAAKAEPRYVLHLSTWMHGNGLGDSAYQWLTLLPESLRKQQPVQMALVDCLHIRKDWKALEELIQDENWEDMDFMRSAFLARAARMQRNLPQSAVHWSDAVKSAGKRAESLVLLHRLASTWEFKQESVDLLWTVARSRSGQRWALQQLHTHYFSIGDTSSLLRVAQRALELMPKDEIARNNLVVYSLLLKINVAQAVKDSTELYQKHPNSPIFASTYALALHVQGRTKEAVEVLKLLKPSDLRNPAVAAYYGILLAELGAKEQALEFLDLAKDAPLLPQEKELVARARQQVTSV